MIHPHRISKQNVYQTYNTPVTYATKREAESLRLKLIVRLNWLEIKPPKIRYYIM